MNDIKEQRKLAILQILEQSGAPLNSAAITDLLDEMGHEVSERTVRLYLQELDEEGLTENMSKRGRRISERGTEEIHASKALARVGLLSAKIDRMTYCMSFDLATRTGTVVVNTTLVTPDQLRTHAEDIQQVFAKGFAMGRLMTLLEPGEHVGDLTVPAGMIGFCSVCSITVNGVLLKHGIPTRSRFGGLMEIRGGKPKRFLEIINYDGTSVDPLLVFIRSAMTDYLGAIRRGEGRIGASFRELPSDSRELVCDLAQKLDAIGLGGFMRIGQPGRDLFDIPVSEGRIGATVIGGLNPVAIFEESGVRLTSTALSGLIDFNRLFPYTELGQRL